MSTFEEKEKEEEDIWLVVEPFDKIMLLCDNKSFAYFIATIHSHPLSRIFYHLQKRRKDIPLLRNEQK